MIQGIQDQGSQESMLRQLAQQYANEALQQKSTDLPQKSNQDQGLLQLSDARHLSDEMMEEVSGKDAQTKGSDINTLVTSLKEMTDSRTGDLLRDVKGQEAGTSAKGKPQQGGNEENGGMALLNSLLEKAFGGKAAGAGTPDTDPADEMQDQDRAGEEGEGLAAEQGAPQAPQAGGPEAAGDKKTVEEVKVSWQPLMQPGQIVNEGEPFGHFQISREKKEVDDKKGPDEGGAPAQPQGAAPQQGAKGKKAQGSAAFTLSRDLPKGSDGKSPLVTQGSKPGEEKKQEKGVEAGEGGKIYLTDQGTGEKMEIPENGDLKATHPMKIKSLGTVGEIKPGDELFAYENPSPDEVENSKKAKEHGQGPEEQEKAKEPDKKAP
jgi:hypothetical protein